FDNEIPVLVDECVRNTNDSTIAFASPRVERAFDVGRVATRCRINGHATDDSFADFSFVRDQTIGGPSPPCQSLKLYTSQRMRALYSQASRSNPAPGNMGSLFSASARGNNSLRQSGLSQAIFQSGEIFRAAKRGPILHIGNA